jgi:hypothetical protein
MRGGCGNVRANNIHEPLCPPDYLSISRAPLSSFEAAATKSIVCARATLVRRFKRYLRGRTRPRHEPYEFSKWL